MITQNEINNLAVEWGLRTDIVEKDYVIGWVLWGVAAEQELKQHWAFKGGTCLKKCFVETWRFSEDLDFTVLPGGPITPGDIKPLIEKVLKRVSDNSGINFNLKEPAYKYFDKYNYVEGSIYYQGPRQAPNPVRIKLDISGNEKVVRPTVLRKIIHPYSDAPKDHNDIRCYGFEEVFAEKIRAMGERSRPRDLYDIVLLYRKQNLKSTPQLIRDVLVEKCKSKGVAFPSFQTINTQAVKAELDSAWASMLGHQLPILPSIDEYWAELPNLFKWLDGQIQPAVLPAVVVGKNEDASWVPPQTIWNWGTGLPLESVRFAAANRLCIRLGYQGTKREIEPYSLRRTKDGNLLLYGVKRSSSELRSYRVDRISSIEVTNTVFAPRFRIGFSAD